MGFFKHLNNKQGVSSISVKISLSSRSRIHGSIKQNIISLTTSQSHLREVCYVVGWLVGFCEFGGFACVFCWILVRIFKGRRGWGRRRARHRLLLCFLGLDFLFVSHLPTILSANNFILFANVPQSQAFNCNSSTQILFVEAFKVIHLNRVILAGSCLGTGQRHEF